MRQRRPAWLLAFAVLAPSSLAFAQPSGFNRAKVPATETIHVVPGTKLADVLARPDTTILVGQDGKQMTVAELKRRKLRRDQNIAALSSRKPSLTGRIVKSPSMAGAGHVKAIVDSLATENSTALSLRSTALSRKTSAPAAPGGKLSEAMKPRLDTVNGKTRNFRVSPGGYLTIEGFGFGDVIGQANVIGQFPGGAAALRVVDWKFTMVYALLPPGIRGVLDHDVSIQLISHDGKTFRLDGGKFVATREEITITTNITRVVDFYTPGTTAGDDGRVYRVESKENIPSCHRSDWDTLEVIPPQRGFVVTGLAANWGRTDSGDGDEFGDDGSRTFTPGYEWGTEWSHVMRHGTVRDSIMVRWGVWRSHTSPDVLLSGWDRCESSYQISASLSGPAGVSPF